MVRWDRVGLPHKGWRYVGIEDLGEEVMEGEDIPYEKCEMCGNENIRYVHILSHPEYKEEIRVGCVCASKMTENYTDPGRNEKELLNRSKRRTSFLRREWKKTDKGFTLRYKGENITIVLSRYGLWGVVFQNQWRWEYHGKKIRDVKTAKLVAFDLFDELHEPNGRMQPFWKEDRWIYY